MTKLNMFILQKSRRVRKIFNYMKNLSLRKKIMLLFCGSLLFMGITAFLVGEVNRYAVLIIGTSYESNERIVNLRQKLVETEKSMEDFTKFFSNELFYQYNKSSESVYLLIRNLQNSPSINNFFNKEYVVRKLIESFLYYSEKSVYAARAQIMDESDFFYKKAAECFAMIIRELSIFENLVYDWNNQDYKDNRNLMNFLTNIIFIFFVFYFVLIALFIYFSITELLTPLYNISKIANKVSERNFDVPLFNNREKNEIGDICRAFDRMLESINEYVKTIEEKIQNENALKQKQIEIQSLYMNARLHYLQAQINPHFIFNTLNTGVQLANLEDADKTANFIEQLAEFFRYNIHEREVATIEEELLLIEHFVYIMKVRFGQRLAFTKDVPKGIFSQKLPVMTLQPLCENCIRHALENQIGEVKLKVEIEFDFIEISVSDNGKGFNSETRKKILEEVREGDLMNGVLESREKEKEDVYNYKGNGIGIVNVFARLKLYFHRNDVFDIQKNDDGEGAKFIVRVPL